MRLLTYLVDHRNTIPNVEGTANDDNYATHVTTHADDQTGRGF